MPGVYDPVIRDCCQECGGVSLEAPRLQPDKERALESLKDYYILPADYKFGFPT